MRCNALGSLWPTDTGYAIRAHTCARGDRASRHQHGRGRASHHAVCTWNTEPSGGGLCDASGTGSRCR